MCVLGCYTEEEATDLSEGVGLCCGRGQGAWPQSPPAVGRENDDIWKML